MLGPPIAESITPTLLVLVGTLLGAMIASGTTVALARSKRRDEARAFARLVEDELQRAVDVVDEYRTNYYPNRPPERFRATLDTAAWYEGRQVLAYGLRRARWDTVRLGCGEVDRLRRSFEDGGKPLLDDQIQNVRVKVIAARDTLHAEGTGAPAAARLRGGARAAGAKLLRWLTPWRKPDDEPRRRGT